MAKTTKDYLAKVRKKTGFSDYKISQSFDINQSNLSKYSSGKSALSETHAWLFANLLGVDPAEVVANTKLEHAKLTNNKLKAKFWKERLDNLKPNSSSAKIKIAQINPTVGDIDGNVLKIITLTLEAYQAGVDLLVFPELALTGYSPEDLLLREGFMLKVSQGIDLIIQKIPNEITLLFGAPCLESEILYNSAYLLQDGLIQTYHKMILPNYGVFDEKRYFTPGVKPLIFKCKGERFGVVICEDAWEESVIEKTNNFGVDTIISLNASPFEMNKHEKRISMIKQRVLENKVSFIYVNMVGGQDEIVFDGGSFAINSLGKITTQLPFFEETDAELGSIHDNGNSLESHIYQALVLSTRDYINKNKVFDGAVIGLSGGIDSALTLAIAVDAIGAAYVQAVMMPYTYTANISLEDAKSQTQRMGVDYQEIDIHTMVDDFNDKLSPLFAYRQADTTEENIQARVRGTLLMAISNKLNKIVLTTGNKSEMAVGYATLYGDMAGGFAPLKDLPKTWVYRLAKYRNTLSADIPLRVIEREPSAELAPNQLDKDSLPPYDVLDEILKLFLEKRKSISDIVQCGFEELTVHRIIKMVINSEYKRRQSAPGTKITRNAFGKERRYPITTGFKF
jgi:NAD+ synthase (glutamine-hydrolysing)